MSLLRGVIDKNLNFRFEYLSEIEAIFENTSDVNQKPW